MNKRRGGVQRKTEKQDEIKEEDLKQEEFKERREEKSLEKQMKQKNENIIFRKERKILAHEKISAQDTGRE